MKSAKEIRIKGGFKSPMNHSRLQSCITLLMLCMTLMLALPGHAQIAEVPNSFENTSAPPLLVPGQPEPINLTFLGDNSSLYVCTKGGTGTSTGSKSRDTTTGTTSKGKKSSTVSAASTVFSTSCVLPPQDSLTLTTENNLPNAITAFGNDASFINLSMPLNMVAGQSYDVAVSMKNTGNTTWQPGTWKLGSQAPQDNTLWGPNRVQLAAPVGPGGSVAFFFTIRAPTTPGVYTYKWQMVQEFVEFFGAPTTAYQITVTAPPPPTAAPTLTVTRTPTTMVANQSFTLNWSTTNATSLTRVCTSTGTGFVANGSLATSGSAPGTASSAWVGFPSTCTWTATGAGGSKQVIETMTTNAAAPPSPPPPSGPTVTYIHTDGLGNPVARTNEKGELISRTRYEPYGATAGGATPGIGFTGHVNDPETGLTYMQQRYYDPLAGRFMSVDPVLTDANTGAAFNRYVYANNSPYRYIDPDGRQARDIESFCPTGTCTRYGGSSANSGNPGGLEQSLQGFKPSAMAMGQAAAAVLDGYMAGAEALLAVSGAGKIGLRLIGSIGLKAGAEVAAPVSLGSASFSAANNIGQLYSPNVILNGRSILFQDFSVGTARGFMGLGEKGAAELYGPMRQLINYSQRNGATSITLSGRYATPEGAALGGGQVGQSFSFSFQATREGLTGFLKQLGSK
jgi:RHS repeat-associated protein